MWSKIRPMQKLHRPFLFFDDLLNIDYQKLLLMLFKLKKGELVRLIGVQILLGGCGRIGVAGRHIQIDQLVRLIFVLILRRAGRHVSDVVRLLRIERFNDIDIVDVRNARLVLGIQRPSVALIVCDAQNRAQKQNKKDSPDEYAPPQRLFSPRYVRIPLRNQ